MTLLEFASVEIITDEKDSGVDSKPASTIRKSLKGGGAEGRVSVSPDY